MALYSETAPRAISDVQLHHEPAHLPGRLGVGPVSGAVQHGDVVAWQIARKLCCDWTGIVRGARRVRSTSYHPGCAWACAQPAVSAAPRAGAGSRPPTRSLAGHNRVLVTGCLDQRSRETDSWRAPLQARPHRQAIPNLPVSILGSEVPTSGLPGHHPVRAMTGFAKCPLRSICTPKRGSLPPLHPQDGSRRRSASGAGLGGERGAVRPPAIVARN